MKRTPDTPSPLSVHRMFVVQFRAETDLARRNMSGKVEHVTSGRVAQFGNLEDLLEFFEDVLKDDQSPSSGKP